MRPRYGAGRQQQRTPAAHVGPDTQAQYRQCRFAIFSSAQASKYSPAAAQLVGLGDQHGVHDLFGEPAEQLLHLDSAVVEPGMTNMSRIGSDKISTAVFVLF